MGDCEICQASIDDVCDGLTSGCSNCYPKVIEQQQAEIEKLRHENQRLVAANYGVKLIKPKFTPRAMGDAELVEASKIKGESE